MPAVTTRLRRPGHAAALVALLLTALGGCHRTTGTLSAEQQREPSP